MKGYYKNDMLKFIAAFFMIIDHVGAIFFENLVILRYLGRIAFPIFAFYVAMGFFWTSDFKKYISRILIFAVIAQIPYAFFSFILTDNYYGMNILFTFFIALFALYFFKRKNYSISVLIIVLCEVIQALTLIKFDYGVYGILMVFAFYIFKDDKIHRNLSIFCLTIAYIFTIYLPLGIPFYYSFIHRQMFCVLALPLIDLNYKTKILLPRYFFYIFYPAHIAIIVFVYFILS
ncbi:conjugal transfer protein TraX [Alkalibaculum sp. M08DMB]|uniref:Conjugal transfer protein TraX n=1 Tax=Alkalibaculum sporogenes TaxID=2655001 RepID=A0A6A7KCL6_9FIRM|nr:TraX family protein [Alkalibaculum sporogenes]MPW27095.1 conjugal transfer protein TraX [Alkalibaculum sporogenes]